ncbi:MAG: glutamine synthetase III [Clostridia bacterium]|nr:glutamine synthetase III [Clostridia bacterium]
MGEKAVNIPEIFGSLVFNDKEMRERLPEDIYASLQKTLSEGGEIEKDVANAVASALKDWAISKGATHFTHWFQPMTGITAEKHDSFITAMPGGTAIMEFSGKSLIKGEPDASSFPSGGLRATFEARGYTSWDPTSSAFIKDNCLCIPTVFRSFSGEVLDMKTPLLRSMELINTEALRILRLFDINDVTKVTPTVGPEQEYFLVDRKMAERRRDLMLTGRTLFGAKPPKGQELADHYFGSLRPRVREFMQELNEELWKLGVYAKTEHNEAAPAQHELAPIFVAANLAADHNQLTMEKMKIIAENHGLLCLLHEKPFEGVNGSGKHNNWSLETDTGNNLLRPGHDPAGNKLFLLMLVAVISAVHKHQDLLRIAVASASNDNRLGGNEAPPAIVSMFIGSDLEGILNSMAGIAPMPSAEVSRKLDSGVKSLPNINRDKTDRNRTSPFAFTGNKFEFRMLGSSLSVAETNVIINTIVADELRSFAEVIEAAPDRAAAIDEVIVSKYREHSAVIFNGNNYDPGWSEEAKHRGLLNLPTTPDALPYLTSEENIGLFARNHVYSETELVSRQEILYDKYEKDILIEANTMIEMASRQILPGVIENLNVLLGTLKSRHDIGLPTSLNAERLLIEKIDPLAKAMVNAIDSLRSTVDACSELAHAKDKADFCRDRVIPAMKELRTVSDSLEEITGEYYWPFPTYADLLYGV